MLNVIILDHSLSSINNFVLFVKDDVIFDNRFTRIIMTPMDLHHSHFNIDYFAEPLPSPLSGLPGVRLPALV